MVHQYDSLSATLADYLFDCRHDLAVMIVIYEGKLRSLDEVIQPKLSKDHLHANHQLALPLEWD